VEAKHKEWKSSGMPERNLLEMLLKHKEEGLLTQEDVISEVIQFIFAGHETTSRALTALFYHVLRNPNVLKKIKQEIKDVVLEGQSSVDNIENSITQDKLLGLSYLLMCIKETLRMDAPVSAIPYEAKVTFKLSNGVTVHKGTRCTPNVVLVHNNPLIWQNPREFIPERFDIHSEYFLTPSGEKRHPYSYMPFVAGPRNCIGQNFAMLEIKHIVVYLLSNFRFELVKDVDNLLFGMPSATPLDLMVTKINSIDEI